MGGGVSCPGELLSLNWSMLSVPSPPPPKLWSSVEGVQVGSTEAVVCPGQGESNLLKGTHSSLLGKGAGHDSVRSYLVMVGRCTQAEMQGKDAK